MNRAPNPRATWTPRRATETEPKLEPVSRFERWSNGFGLWLMLSGIGLAMGYGAGDQQVIFLAAVALAVAVTLWVAEWRMTRRVRKQLEARR